MNISIQLDNDFVNPSEYINCLRNKIIDIYNRTGLYVKNIQWVIFDGPKEKVKRLPEYMQPMAYGLAKQNESTKGQWSTDNVIKISAHVIQNAMLRSVFASIVEKSPIRSARCDELADVIIHELVHAQLREGHTDRFWNVYRSYRDNYYATSWIRGARRSLAGQSTGETKKGTI